MLAAISEPPVAICLNSLTNNDAADEDGGGIPSLDHEATFFAWNGLMFRKNCSLQLENYGLNAANC